VTIPNPEHLLEQAEKLIYARPRQVDLRRAISTVYYALFHAIMTETADVVVGAGSRATERYGLVYRSVDHRRLRELREGIQRSSVRDRYKRFEPSGGFTIAIKGFAATVLEFQRKRHAADYDPLARFKTETQLDIAGGKAALAQFRAVGDEEWQIFVSLLLFSPRETGRS
jgi:hypothetical protein